MAWNSLVTALKDLFLKQLPKVALAELVMYGVSRLIDNPTIVDVTWCLNHWLVGTSIATNNFSNLSLVFSGTKNKIHFALLTAWLARLGGFLLYTRILKPYVDPRYKTMAAKRGINENLYYFIQFQGQGVLSCLTSLPLYFLFNQSSQELGWNNYLGIGMAVVGILGEAVADQQLYNFKNQRKEKSEHLKTGLWKKSRHPNLFFELLFWFGLATTAIDLKNVQGTAWAYGGPLFLFYIMNNLTIPITTSHMKKTKPDFEEHMKNTNKFWPF